MGNIKRSWTMCETHVVHEIFRENLEKGKLLSLNDCQKEILFNDELRKRSPAQLKTWLHNQITQKKHNHLLKGEFNVIL